MIIDIAYAQAGTTTDNTITEYKIAENYFSDILNAQLVIFSIIVGVIVALYFFFNYKISKTQIKKEVSDVFDEFKNDINTANEENTKVLADNLASQLAQHESMITSLRGEVYRTLGQFWDSEKSFSTAFIWWIRAAYQFSQAGEETLVRLALSSAKDSVERIALGFELNYDLIGEYQRLFSEINDKMYKIEKDLLDKAIKDALNRKLITPISK